MKYGFVYITTNLVNGARYIGQHTGFNDSYLGSGTLLSRAVLKYGHENFKREIVDCADSQEELDKKEIEWIAKYNAVEDPMFYNIAEGGNVINYWKGKKRSEETKRKISENNGMRNPEAIKRMKELMTGKKNPRAGNGHTQKGKDNPMYGRSGKSNISISLINKVSNEIINFDAKYKAELWLIDNSYEISRKGARLRLKELIETESLLDEKYLFYKGSIRTV